MDEVKRISELLRETYEGNPWHGLSLKDILSGVTSRIAAMKMQESSHTIWEDVNHITAWMEIPCRRLSGEAVEATNEQDWPPVTEETDAAWKRTLGRMDESFDNLMNAISKLHAHDLEKKVAGKDYDGYTMLHGVINHNVYHSSQISLMKKELAKSG